MTARRDATVLVLSHLFDPTADYVIHELNTRGVNVFRCDPGEFPERLGFTASLGAGWGGSLHLPERTVRLEEITCGWYRRPTQFGMPPQMSDVMRRFASAEARMGFGGILADLPWLNHPFALARANYKPHQLTTARACGLAVPDTIITNDLEAARKFTAGHGGQVIYKPFTQGVLAEAETEGVIYATPVTLGQLDERICLTAHMLQRQIPKAHELRVTVIDDTILTARIDARSAKAAVDWRSDYQNLEYQVVDALPAEVTTGIAAMMKAHGLRFAALDFIVDPAGTHHFLDLNPNGQFAWIEDETGLAISAAIADALTQGARP